MKPQRLDMLDGWLDEIHRHVTEADTLERRVALTHMYREAMHKLYLRIDDYDSVLVYRKHMDKFIKLNTVRE